MSIIGPGWGGDPYKLSKPQLDTGTTSANLDVAPKPNPDVVSKKPADEFISRDLGLTSPKNPKSNAVDGWESLAAAEETELLAPAKSDAVTSQPIEASNEERNLVIAELMKTTGKNAPIAQIVTEGLTQS